MGTSLVFVDGEMQKFMSTAGLHNFDDFLQIKNAEVVRDRTTSSLRRVMLTSKNRTEHVFIKTYDYTRMPLLRRLGAEKAEREAANYLAMRACAMGVPDLIGFGSRRRVGLLQESFLITRECRDSINLEEKLAAYPNKLLRRQLLTDAARQIARMHARGFFHIDLQFRNIMVRGAFELVLLDSPRGGYRSSRAAREYGRLRDLSSLYKDARRFFTRTDLLRWLYAYTGTDRLGPQEKLLIWSILRDRSSKDYPPA
jgi:tRNA A-37 threonylcarbamoyl transferase component Bud32